jgi:hypothetical protein
MRLRLLATLAAVASAITLRAAEAASHPDTQTIIQRSVQSTEKDFQADPLYSRRERELEPDGWKTYEVYIVLGSPYKKLIAINGKPLSKEESAHQQQLFEQEVQKRRAETPAERANRIARYAEDRRRDESMIREMINAFDFMFCGSSKAEGHPVWVLDAKPRSGYHPPDVHARALTGMEGRLWIDQQSFQWVKVEAHVVHPVSIYGFVAKVEPGTRFELEKMPVPGGVWMPKHFRMKAKSTILWLFNKHEAEESYFFDYRMDSILN